MGDCIFLVGCLLLFFFNWALYKLHFLSSHFSFQPNKKKKKFVSLHFSTLLTKHKWGKLKSFLSSHFSILSPFSILSLFHPPNQTDPKRKERQDKRRRRKWRKKKKRRKGEMAQIYRREEERKIKNILKGRNKILVFLFF